MKKVYFYLFGVVAAAATLSTQLPVDDHPAEYNIAGALAPAAADTVKNTDQPKSHVLTGRSSQSGPLASGLSTTHTGTVSTQQLPQGASAGDELTYSVIIRNNGTENAEGVRYTSTLDPNTTLVPGSLKVSPIATDDVYNTIGNVDLVIPAEIGLLANDTSPDGTALTITSGSTVTTTAGASVALNTTTGAFAYTPKPGFSGEDTFQYTVESATGLTVTANVKITSVKSVWFIDAATNVDASERNGTLLKPFKTINGFQGRNDNGTDHPGNNDYIFVYSGAYTGSITLLPGQRIIGQGVDTAFHQLEGLIRPSGNNLIPSTSGVNPVINSNTNTILSIGTNNVIRGIDFTSATNTTTKIKGYNFVSLKISETKLLGNGPAIDLTNGKVEADFTELSSVTSGSSAVNLQNLTGNFNSATGSISSTNFTGISIQGNATNKLNLGVNLLSFSSSTTNKGIIISNTTGFFTVTGTGTTPGSGGTIQEINLRGAEFTNATGIKLVNMNFINANKTIGTLATTEDNTNCNAAIFASTVSNLELDNVTISGTTVGQGINLNAVNNFKLLNSSVTGTGSGFHTEQGAIYAINTSGSVQVSKSNVSNSNSRLANFYNSQSAPVNIVIDDSDFIGAINGAGVMMEGSNTAVMTMKFHNQSKIQTFATSGLAVYANEDSNLKIDILNSEITGEGQGVDFGAGGNGKISFNVKNNAITTSGYSVVSNYMFDNGFIEGTYESNTINAAGTNFTNTIAIESIASLNHIVKTKGVIRVANNTINVTNGNAISVLNSSSATDRIDLTLTNNNIVNATSNQMFVIDVGVPDIPQNIGVFCLNANGNTITQNSTNSEGLLQLRTSPSPMSQIMLVQANDIVNAWNSSGNMPAGAGSGNQAVIKTGIGSITAASSCVVPSNPALRMISEEPIAGRVDQKNSENEQFEEKKQDVIPSSGIIDTPQEQPAIQNPAQNARTAGITAGETITVQGTGSGFTIPAGREMEIRYQATINSTIPANTCQVTNVGEVSGTGFDPFTTNMVTTTVVSAPTFSSAQLSDVTLNPDAGTCDFTQSSPFVIAATGCPSPTLSFKIAGSDITFPYQFPEGNTVVEVTASNGVGSPAVSSFTVIGQPLAAPVLSTQPQNQVVCVGSEATFTVTPEASSGLTYQWQRMGATTFENITLAENSTANSASLVIEGVQMAANGQSFRCIVSNPCTDQISDVVTLTVNSITSADLTGTIKVYTNDSEPLLTFSATGGQLPYIFTYTVNGGTSQTVQTTQGNSSATVAQVTDEVGEFEYVLVSVTDALNCSFTPSSVKSATITVEVDLPVNLIEFSASENENSVLLLWSTSFETNSSHFVIQRSRDSRQWNDLGVVEAKGESKDMFRYQWKDMDSFKGISYYRLKMTDKDGSYEYSPIRSIDRKSIGAELIIYPNPVQDRVYLDVDISKVTKVEMIDMVGKSVFSKKNPYSTLFVDKLPPATYLLKVHFNDGTITTRKVIINR